MNQVMINAVELQTLMDELKDLRDENFKLKTDLGRERDLVKILKSEVAWAENGYSKKDWVGLTNDEVLKTLGVLEAEEAVFRIANAVEARLKEKNGG